MIAEQLHADAVAAARSGHALLGVSYMFLVAVGWWGARQSWWEAGWAAAAALVLAWCAGGELAAADTCRGLARAAAAGDEQLAGWLADWQRAGVA